METRPPTEASLSRALCDWWQDSVRRRGLGPTLGIFLKEVGGFLRESTPERRRRRYGDVDYDWDHRVDTTSATVSWRSRLLGALHSPYQPTEPALFQAMIESLRVEFSGFTFVDLGSGKGRTLLMASEYPFRKIIGVELLPELHAVACENLRKYASETQRCFVLESTCGDAREFRFPAEPTVLYLFNPLPESGLVTVVRHLEESLQQHRRQVFVLYHNPLLQSVLRACPALHRIGGTDQYSVFSSQ